MANYITDSGKRLYIAARVYNDAAIPLTTGVGKFLTFNQERFDTAGIHDVGSNTDRLTIPENGKYLIIFNGAFESNSTNTRQFSFQINGSTEIANTTVSAANGFATRLCLTTIYDLSASEYVRVRAYQNSTVELDITVEGNISPEFSICKIAD